MKIDTFLVEQWLNKYEQNVEINISETCIEPFTIREFLSLMGREDFFRELQDTQLTYGVIPGSDRLRSGIANLYPSFKRENILIAGGAISANFIVIFSLVEPGDTVICVHPTYQQLYSIPVAFGAKVKLLKLKKENKWILDINELESLVDEKTKMIIINNPNNPTGSLTRNDHLKEICRIAENVGAYIFSDESYRGIYINQEDQVPSIAELSQNGISTGSFSKPFSLTGLRLGWIAARKSIIKECEKRRDYTTISNAMIDDALATLAVENVRVIQDRNQNIVDRNFRILSSWVNDEPLIDWIPPEAGSVAFLHYKLPIDSEELCKLLLDEEDVLLVPGSCFDMDNYLRIGWGGNSEVLKEGLRRFKNFLNGYRD